LPNLKQKSHIFENVTPNACQATVRSPDVKVKTDGGTEIEIGDDQNNGKFCPPGQAKKGNC